MVRTITGLRLALALPDTFAFFTLFLPSPRLAR